MKKAIDHITVDRIAVHAFHGVMPEEKVLGQRFFISLDVEIDLRTAGQSDLLSETISYARLTEIACQIATNNRFKLIEALAESIASAILSEFRLAQGIKVKIEKPSAPIAAIFDTVAIELYRSRSA